MTTLSFKTCFKYLEIIIKLNSKRIYTVLLYIVIVYYDELVLQN